MGDAHVDVLVERLKRKFGAIGHDRQRRACPTARRSAPTAKVDNKFKRQTGGHGQYGHVVIEFEPDRVGTGFEFGDKIVGGVVPKQYIPAVEKGLREALAEGVLAGYPVVDLARHAGGRQLPPGRQLRDGLQGGRQPGAQAGLRGGRSRSCSSRSWRCEVVVPDEYMGDVMGQITAKRGHVLGMDSADGMQHLHAQVPQAEMFHYATELRSHHPGPRPLQLEARPLRGGAAHDRRAGDRRARRRAPGPPSGATRPTPGQG